MEVIKALFKLMFYLGASAYISFLIMRNSEKRQIEDSVSVGNIWMSVPENKDPFKKVKYRCYKVLEVKQGYVKYKYLPNICVNSSEISVFVLNSKKIR